MNIKTNKETPNKKAVASRIRTGLEKFTLSKFLS